MDEKNTWRAEMLEKMTPEQQEVYTKLFKLTNEWVEVLVTCRKVFPKVNIGFDDLAVDTRDLFDERFSEAFLDGDYGESVVYGGGE